MRNTTTLLLPLGSCDGEGVIASVKTSMEIAVPAPSSLAAKSYRERYSPAKHLQQTQTGLHRGKGLVQLARHLHYQAEHPLPDPVYST